MSVRPVNYWLLLLVCSMACAGCAQSFLQVPLTATSSLIRNSVAKQENMGGKFSLARLSERRGQTKEAQKMYLQLVEKHPNDPRPYHRLGVMDARNKQWRRAEQYFNQAYSLGQPSAELLSDMGYFYYLQDRPEDAENILRQALVQDGDYEAAHNNLGLVLGEQQRFAESLDAFQQIGSEGQAHANLAFVLSKQGDYDKALRTYSQALSLDPELRTAAKAMLQLAQHRPALPEDSPSAFSQVTTKLTSSEDKAKLTAERQLASQQPTQEKPVDAAPQQAARKQLARSQPARKKPNHGVQLAARTQSARRQPFAQKKTVDAAPQQAARKQLARSLPTRKKPESAVEWAAIAQPARRQPSRTKSNNTVKLVTHTEPIGNQTTSQKRKKATQGVTNASKVARPTKSRPTNSKRRTSNARQTAPTQPPIRKSSKSRSAASGRSNASKRTAVSPNNSGRPPRSNPQNPFRTSSRATTQKSPNGVRPVTHKSRVSTDRRREATSGLNLTARHPSLRKQPSPRPQSRSINRQASSRPGNVAAKATVRKVQPKKQAPRLATVLQPTSSMFRDE